MTAATPPPVDARRPAPGERGPAPSVGRRRADLLGAWAVGLVGALLVVGPGLGPGAWMNVDLVVTDVTPVPRGAWGLGPELPRRVPFALPFAWLSSVVPGELAWKLAVVVALASTVAGTWRLVARWSPDSSLLARAGAGLVVGVGPFAITRASVGHLGLTLALGVLVWALPVLLRPTRSVARTALWAAALGACGPFGGTFALIVVGVALLTEAPWRPDRRSGAVRAGAVTLLTQGPWLVPTVIVASLGADISSAGDFPTDATGAGGLLRVLAGHGFWLTPDQVGRGQGWTVPLAGLGLAVLAAYGRAEVPAAHRRPATAVALVGLGAALAAGLPGLRDVLDAVTAAPGLGLVREAQRLGALYLVLAVPAAALGACRLGRRVGGAVGDAAPALPLVAALLLVPPGLFGAGGALDPVEVPEEWAQARAVVDERPGTVLALPWATYTRLDITDGRRVVNPLRIYLGGDVLASSDPGFDDGRRERADPREAVAEDLVGRMEAGEAVSPELAALGVRWLVVIPVQRFPEDPIPEDPGLRTVLRSEAMTLVEVRGWAAARTSDGRARSVDPVVAPLQRAASDPLVLSQPGTGGWWRGTQRARAEGPLLAVPDGGMIVYPWALPVLAADLAVLVVVAGAARRLRRRIREHPANDTGVTCAS